MLSGPDMAAGAFAASLTYNDGGKREFKCPDKETVDIIEEFANIKELSEYKKEELLYPIKGVSIFDMEFNQEQEPYLRHKLLALTPNKDKIRAKKLIVLRNKEKKCN